MRKRKINRTLFTITFLSFYLLFFAITKEAYSKTPFQQKDLIGTWAHMIKTEGDSTSNMIYIQLTYQKDGILKIKGNGILYDTKGAAFFEVNETHHWYIKENMLNSEYLDCNLISVTGDPKLQTHVKSIFISYRENLISKQSLNLEIQKITPELFISVGEENNEKVIYHHHRVK